MTTPTSRSLRADAARNRQQLLDVATRVLAEAEGEPSMRAIAREAGVGIGTLYRHFPTREALVAAVYQDQVARLTTGAEELLAAEEPSVALRHWMDRFGEWVAAKSGMLATLLTMIDAGDLAHTRTRDELLAAVSTILEAGAAAGDLREDVTAEEVSAGLIGIFTVAHQPGNTVSADRLLDIFLDGLRPQDRS
ncbi:AcrR family transcriptional regulator [Nocardioides luteus]|uniref:TetR family transcriptional regulator n=1 Tax=Nocardioides luteus TaxID=1844 RepID=A0ABQ5SZR7_9ACTN|nr:TetR/AcrR family transcriptional regulator [Nocardioides luteus]MDR7310532.1 AcrR family transcriptional regulator [Nocardioides luteus]GGR42202.1 TetR family transcriptional regulator [Nocardioides luteus]GLJ69687.1 TetR family transcriptional regulator [Nocardioides luteus]